jgi:hypothetical protein
VQNLTSTLDNTSTVRKNSVRLIWNSMRATLRMMTCRAEMGVALQIEEYRGF